MRVNDIEDECVGIIILCRRTPKERVECHQEIELRVKIEVEYSRERQGVKKEVGVHVRG